MPDREKVMPGIGICSTGSFDMCADALDLLKEQEARKTAKKWKVAGAFDDFSQYPECGNMWPMLSTIEWAYCPVCGCRILSVPESPKEET